MVNKSGYLDKRKLTVTEAWCLATLINALGEWAARCHQRHQRPFQQLKTPLYNLLKEPK